MGVPEAGANGGLDVLGGSIADVKLTPRQEDVAKLCALDLTFKQIGKRLGISHRTARIYAVQAREKLNLDSKVQLAVYARIRWGGAE